MTSLNCIIIPLTHGYSALISEIDSDLINLKWHISDTGYAVRRTGTPKKTVRLHRLIAERIHTDISDLVVDHINGNRLDNRRENLRPVSISLNCSNACKSKSNTSGYKGVRFESSSWRVTIKSNGSKYDFGRYVSPELAAQIFDCATIKLNGLILNGLNFPNQTTYSSDVVEIVEYILSGKRLPNIPNNHSSLFRGISFRVTNQNKSHQSTGWVATFMGKYIGYFSSEIDAAIAWDKNATSYGVPRLFLNFKGGANNQLSAFYGDKIGTNES